MPLPQARRIRRSRRGDFVLRLPSVERAILRELPARLRELLQSDDPAVGRLFPPAYQDDPVRDAEYRRLMRDELLAERLRAVEVMEATVDATRLDESQLTAWLAALNDLRLLLGTKLDVTEETYEQDVPDDHPDAQAHALFLYLGWLEGQVVDALASTVDDGEPG